MAILRWIVACLLTAAWLSAVHGTTLAVCKDRGGAELAPACQQALRQASVAETLALVEPWVASGNSHAQQVEVALSLSAGGRIGAAPARCRAAEEATWLARKLRAAPGAPVTPLWRKLVIGSLAKWPACVRACLRLKRDATLLAAKGDILKRWVYGEAVAAIARQWRANLACVDAEDRPLAEGALKRRRPRLMRNWRRCNGHATKTC
jgi:hypothetical protein